MNPGLRRRSRAWRGSLPALLAVVACRDSIGPTTMTFSVHPVSAVAGEPINPAVEVAVRDAFGEPVGGAVTISLDPNPCNWRLSGTLTVELVNGTARFADLTMDKVGRGYTLRAAYGSLSAPSQPFVITSPIVDHPLIHQALICTKPNAQSDGESLTWVPEDDAFWIADDDRVAIYQVERRSGQTLSSIKKSDFVAALPDAANCDDGDGDPSTTCSYVDEFEQVAYDVSNRILYVVNTVNTARDRPAIFRLRKQTCPGCFTIQDWQPLPLGPTYGALVVAGGNVLVAHRKGIYDYDYATNRVATVNANGDSLPPLYATPGNVIGLGFDGAAMWILSDRRVVHRVAWATKTPLAQYDIAPFSITTPKGVEAIRDTIYVLEGDIPNPINVFTIR